MPVGESCGSDSKCEATPESAHYQNFLGLTAGEDYTFYFQSESRGLFSDVLDLNQPTYTADQGAVLEVSSDWEQTQVTCTTSFEPGTGSILVFSYIGENSGTTYSEEKAYTLVFGLQIILNLTNRC